MKIVLAGEVLAFRSFNGANKALPVLASSLNSEGFSSVLQIDLERESVTPERLLRECAEADLIAFAGCMTPQWPELDLTLQRVHRRMVEVGRQHVPLIVGGYATKGAEDIARASPWITAFFDGEGEEGIINIANAVARGTFMAERATIPGICFVAEDGSYHESTAPRVHSLDPYDQNYGFEHEPHKHDMDIFLDGHGRQLKTGQFYTQRGCPYACGYCNKSQESNAVARLSEEAMRAQLSDLRARGYEAVYLDVDTFTVNRKKAMREAELLHEANLIWGSNTRIDSIDPEQMSHMVANGCRYMFFGVEHTLPEVALAIDKYNGSLQSKLEQAAAYPAKVKEVFTQMGVVGLPSSYFVILGLPKARMSRDRSMVVGYEQTTLEDDVAAIQYGVEECDPDFLNFNLLRFMPGSRAADIEGHRAFSVIRPSKEKPVTAGYFLPRIAEMNRYHLERNHGIYRMCESIGANQPTTTAMDPEKVHRCMSIAIDLINRKIDKGGKATKLFLDKEVVDRKLVERSEAGRYSIVPLKEFECLA